MMIQNNKARKNSWRPKWWERSHSEHYTTYKEEETQNNEEAKKQPGRSSCPKGFIKGNKN